MAEDGAWAGRPSRAPPIAESAPAHAARWISNHFWDHAL